MHQPDLILRPTDATATWREVHKGMRRFVELADGHYTHRSRRKEPGVCYREAGWTDWRHPNPDQNVEKWWMKAPRPVREAR